MSTYSGDRLAQQELKEVYAKTHPSDMDESNLSNKPKEPLIKSLKNAIIVPSVFSGKNHGSGQFLGSGIHRQETSNTP